MSTLDVVWLLLPPDHPARPVVHALTGTVSCPVTDVATWQTGLVAISRDLRASRVVGVITAEPDPAADNPDWPDTPVWRATVDQLSDRAALIELPSCDPSDIARHLRLIGLDVADPIADDHQADSQISHGQPADGGAVTEHVSSLGGNKAVADASAGRRSRNVLRVRSAGAMSGRGDLIHVTSAGGGPGKSTIAAALAADAAARGLEVCVIEASSGQPTQAAMLGVDPDAHLPTLFEAALTGNPEMAFAGPDDINPSRPRDLRPVRFTLAAAPAPEEVDDAPVDTAVISRVLDHALDRFDLVIVDCPILKGGLEGRDLLDLLLPTLQFGNAWLVAVTEDSAPMLEDLLRRLDRLIVEHGISSDRILTVLNKVWPGLDVPEAAIAAALEHNADTGTRRSRHVGSIPMDPLDIKQRSNYGVTLEKVAVMQPVIGAILSQVCDLEPEVNPWQPPPRPSAWSRLTGRRGRAGGARQQQLPNADHVSTLARAGVKDAERIGDSTPMTAARP